MKGYMMKFNCNKNFRKGVYYKYSIFPTIMNGIVSSEEAEFPNEFEKLMKIQDNKERQNIHYTSQITIIYYILF